MYSRYHDIDRPANGTCEWLLQHETYRRWAAGDRGLLWIKGKPGSGKSTLIKSALENNKAMRDDLVLSFFFHGRGDELQRTPLGLIRALLHQVLAKAPWTLSDLVGIFKRKCSEIGEPGEKWQWDPQELMGFFELSLPKILEAYSVWLFIDALDECGESNATSLVRSFTSLLRDRLPLSSSLKRFHICFACRPYPILSIDDHFEIAPENENDEDISTFVETCLSQANVPTTSKISSMIITRASGVFLWARLVVDIATRLHCEGRSLAIIATQIQRIPKELYRLYQQLLNTMEEERPTSLKLIQWICFAMRPLSLDEMRWAMVLETGCSFGSLKEYENIDEWIPDNDRMKRRVQTLSCGLAEVTLSSDRLVVQFIHQSVKDYFLSEGLFLLNRSPASTDTVPEMAHFQIFRICVAYIAMEEICRSKSYTDNKFPFLRYATTSWVSHLKASNTENIPHEHLLDLVAKLSPTFMEHWAAAYHQLDRWSSNCPRRIIKLVHVISRYGITGLLLPLISQEEKHMGINVRDGAGWTPLSYAAEKGHEGFADLLITSGAEVDSKCGAGRGAGRTPLSYAAWAGHEAVAKLLITSSAEVDSKCGASRTPLSYAADYGHGAVAKLLITSGAEVDSKCGVGRTPLSYAAEEGHEAAAKLLITSGAEVDSKCGAGQTPLSYAANDEHEA
ncbi:ankyrin, partial [Thozetella sp. PMI_491]